MLSYNLACRLLRKVHYRYGCIKWARGSRRREPAVPLARIMLALCLGRRYRIVWLGAASLSAIQREAMHVPMAPRVISNGIAGAKLTSALHPDAVRGAHARKAHPILSLDISLIGSSSAQDWYGSCLSFLGQSLGHGDWPFLCGMAPTPEPSGSWGQFQTPHPSPSGSARPSCACDQPHTGLNPPTQAPYSGATLGR
jgi:hypothetical protein